MGGALFGFDENWLLERMMLLVPFLLSLSVHEWAHAYAATVLGDLTAKQQERLTLNPFSHIDPIGTFVLPLLGVPFAWAKPVPFNPFGFHRGISVRRGVFLVAAAGPISNLALAIVSAVVVAALLSLGIVPKDLDTTFLWFVSQMIWLNIILAVFNLLPIPPLDGSHIISTLIPNRFQGYWQAWSKQGTVILLVLILLLPTVGFDLFGPISRFAETLTETVFSIRAVR